VLLKKHPPTITAVSQTRWTILLQNFVQLFSSVDWIITAHFIIILLINVEMAGSEIQSTFFCKSSASRAEHLLNNVRKQKLKFLKKSGHFAKK